MRAAGNSSAGQPGMPESKPIIVDMHACFGAHMHQRPGLYHVDGASELVRKMDDLGIDAAAISAPDWQTAKGVEPKPYEDSNRLVFKAAEAYPKRLLPMVRLDPKWLNHAASSLRAWARHPLCRGVRLHPQTDHFSINSRDLADPIMRVCDENGLAAHFNTGTYPSTQPMLFLDIASRWPSVRIGLLSAGQCFAHDTLVVMKRCPNVSVICTPEVPASTIQTLIREVGSERVMFGSTFPFDDPGHSVDTIRSLAGVTSQERGNVLGETAVRWMNAAAALGWEG
jgi:predicted TIM-barrel fold metal-dependent hydrolase